MAQSSAAGAQERLLWAAPVPPRCSDPGHCLHLDPRVGRRMGGLSSPAVQRKDPNAPWSCCTCRKAGGEWEAEGWRGQTPQAAEPQASLELLV